MSGSASLLLYLDHPVFQVLNLLVLCCHLKKRLIITTTTTTTTMIMIMMPTLALCMEVASCSWTLNWLLRKPNFLLLSSTWDDRDD